MASFVLQMQEVAFSYGRHRVFHDLSLSVGPGITGLLGPNGAGKSTLMRLAAGITHPDSGDVYTNGLATSIPAQSRALRATIGYLPQSATWRESLTVRDFLSYFAWLRSIPRKNRAQAVEASIQLTQLGALESRKLGALSGGESRRVMLAQALLHRPPLLILDEPTAGLDPGQRHHFRQVLAALRPGTSTLISTHLLEDVVELADHLLVVDAGRLLFHGTTRNLARLVGDETGSVAGIQMGYLKVLATHSAAA